MRNRLGGIKRVVLGLAVVVAVSAPPALASGPTLTDTGSAFWEVNVNGSGFTPSNWAYVKVIEASGVVSADGWYRTSDTLCFRSPFTVCIFGGFFSATLYPRGQCQPGRKVEAVDFATGLKSNVVNAGCR